MLTLGMRCFQSGVLKQTFWWLKTHVFLGSPEGAPLGFSKSTFGETVARPRSRVIEAFTSRPRFWEVLGALFVCCLGSLERMRWSKLFLKNIFFFAIKSRQRAKIPVLRNSGACAAEVCLREVDGELLEAKPEPGFLEHPLSQKKDFFLKSSFA